MQGALSVATPRFGSCGRFVMPWMLAIPLYRNSRMKNVRESRMRPNSSAPLTDFGVLASGSVRAARSRGHVATRAS